MCDLTFTSVGLCSFSADEFLFSLHERICICISVCDLKRKQASFVFRRVDEVLLACLSPTTINRHTLSQMYLSYSEASFPLEKLPSVSNRGPALVPEHQKAAS